MAINYTKEVYSEVVTQKKANEEYINELYGSFNSFNNDEKLNAIDIINSLKQINFEFEKYIIIYNQLVTDTKIDNIYTVLQGDTLPRISQKLFGDYRKWQSIYKFNNLSDVLLSPGDTLKIPEAK